MTVRICVTGAGGRMGRMVLEMAQAESSIAVTAALVQTGSALIGQTIAGVTLTADISRALNTSEVLIDFTCPQSTLAYLAECRQRGVNAVIGTTGFSAQQRLEIEAAAKEIAIVFAPNMSIGANVTLKLIELATRALHENYDIEIIEAHHKNKVDAPSGTALKMGEVAAACLGKSLTEIGVFERHGHTGARRPGTIGFSTIRGGDLVGDHTVMYAGTGERIEITHRSSSRANYAHGALQAAKFVVDRKSGLFDMQDVLGLG